MKKEKEEKRIRKKKKEKAKNEKKRKEKREKRDIILLIHGGNQHGLRSIRADPIRVMQYGIGTYMVCEGLNGENSRRGSEMNREEE